MRYGKSAHFLNHRERQHLDGAAQRSVEYFRDEQARRAQRLRLADATILPCRVTGAGK